MTRRSVSFLTSLKDVLKNTPISRIDGVKTLYKKLIESQTPNTPTKIEYMNSFIWVIPNRSSAEKSLYAFGEYEPHISTKIESILETGDIAVDIGAHVGHHAVNMRDKVGETGEVHMFEPSPDRAKILNRTAEQYKNMKLWEVALSDDEEITQISGKVPTIQKKSEGVEIKTTTFDQVFKEKEFTEISLVKMDIEGHEIQAIKGMAESIGNINDMVVETHTNMIQEKYSKQDIETAVDILSSFDTIYNIQTGKEYQSVTEIFDASGRVHIHFQQN